MRATAQAAKHRVRVVAVARLAQDVAVDDDNRVAADRDRIGNLERTRLLTREAHGVFARGFAREVRFVDVGGTDIVLDAHESEELAPARRCRRENDTRMGQRSSHSVTGPSLTSSTSIDAPNSPVWTPSPRSLSISMKRS